MSIAMTPVKSSNIKAIGRDGTKLRVQFHQGDPWEFEDAAHHYEHMTKDGVSPGKYFHANIKGQCKGRKVTE